MRRTNPPYPTMALFIAAAALLLVSPSIQALAQSQPPVPYSIFDGIRYDAARNGTLLYVNSGGVNSRTQYFGVDWSLEQWAEANGRRILAIGNITVVPPNTMQVIEQRPGPADPYAKLKPEERFKVLLSLFSEDQWKRAGSPAGIGPEDLNDSQRQLFLGLLPEKISLQQNRLVAGSELGSMNYEPQGGQVAEDPATARIRLNRKVSFGFSRPGSTESSYMGGVEPMEGEVISTLLTRDPAKGDVQSEPGTIRAFGVPVVMTVPSQLKPGHLEYTQPALRVQIPLDQDIKTVADLLLRVTKATGLDLVADKRLSGLALLWRIGPVKRARADDLLKAVCWSVTGTFRRVGSSTYLLTDDIQGIGTRFAKLADWAEKPYIERDKALAALNEKTAKNNPLSHIGFAPNDPYALPSPVQQRVDSAYLKAAEDPWVSPSELPLSLQRQIEKQLEWWEASDIALRDDRVQVSTQMTVQFVFPDGATVEAPFSENIGRQYLRSASNLPKLISPAAPGSLIAPKPMPASLHKRILVARLPEQDKSIVELLNMAKRKGFSEVWLHVMLDDREAAERLRSALKMAHKVGISAGCAASLLQEGGLAGQDDLNILSETGDAYAKRRLAADPDFKYEYPQYTGWKMLDPVVASRILESLASIQGLSALALKATAAPGWAADTPGGDGIDTNGYFGYTEDTRLQCIRSDGYDPIDISPYLYTLDLDPTLPLFPTGSAESGIWKSLCDFRFHENTKRLGLIHAGLKKAAPSLPLYLDDRAIIYTQRHLCWYGRWDKASRMPKNQIFVVESEERADAYASTDEPIRIQYGSGGKPAAVAVRFGAIAQDSAKHWRGVALDIARSDPADAIRILNALPDSP